MTDITDSEKKLLEIYKKLRIKEIENKNKMKQEITLTEQSILEKETSEIENEINKIRNHFSELFYKKWIKQWDEVHNQN